MGAKTQDQQTYPAISTGIVRLDGGTFDAHVSVVGWSLPVVVILPALEVSVPAVAAHDASESVRMRQHKFRRHFV